MHGLDDAGGAIRAAAWDPDAGHAETWDAYVGCMAKSGEYFDAPMLLKLADVVEHPVVVFAANLNTGGVYSQVYGHHWDPQPAIPLWFNGVNHYDLVDETWARDQGLPLHWRNEHGTLQGKGQVIMRLTPRAVVPKDWGRAEAEVSSRPSPQTDFGDRRQGSAKTGASRLIGWGLTNSISSRPG